jgi:hypothetical protein
LGHKSLQLVVVRDCKMTDMKELIRKRLGLAAAPPAGPAKAAPEKETPPKREADDGAGEASDVDHESEGPRHEEEDETQPSVCDCGRCQEFVAAKRPTQTSQSAGRGRGGNRGGRGGNPWGAPPTGTRATKEESEDEDDHTPLGSTACASCGCDLIKHVVPGQLEDEDGFEDEDYDPVYGEHD